MWEHNRPTPFNPSNYPVIVQQFIQLNLALDIAKPLRLVNKAYLGYIDTLLFSHADITATAVNDYTAALIISFSHPWKLHLMFPVLEITERMKKLFSFVRILDIYGVQQSRIIRPHYFGPAPSSEQYVYFLTQLAPHLCNLEVVRQYTDLGPLDLRFTATTLVSDDHIFYTPPLRTAPVSFLGSSSFQRLYIDLLTHHVERSRAARAAGGSLQALHYPSNITNVILIVDYHSLLKDYFQTEEVKAIIDINWLLQQCDSAKPAKVVTIELRDDYDVDADIVLACGNKLSPILLSLLAANGANSQQAATIMEGIQIKAAPPIEERLLISSALYHLYEIPLEHRLIHTIDTLLVHFLQDLETAFIDQTDAFSVGGTVGFDPSLGNVGIYVKDMNKMSHWFGLPFSDAQAEKLYQMGHSSPFGRGGELVFDESYRVARQIMPRDFALAGEVLAQGSILQKIQLALDTGPLYATVSKLNIYPEGGMFKAHRDTPRGDNHIGTIMLCLPSSFTGGELVVRHNGEEQVFDWSSTGGSRPHSAELHWAFLFSDCEHEVLPVKSGKRVTVAYDVFVLPEEVTTAMTAVSAPARKAMAALQAALASPEVLPEGGVLAFALSHEYASVPDKTADFARMLKGVDKTWKKILVDAGLEHEFVAIYQGEDTYQVKGPLSYKKRRHLASRNFHAYEGYNDASEMPVELEEIPVQNVHWVTKPVHWGIKQNYVSNGNEQNSYVAVGLYAYIGPPGARTSGKIGMFQNPNARR